MNKKHNTFNFLDGGGEMGELIRAKDWSKTPLGNPLYWPSSLRTMVGVMLDNPFGMYIAWGKDYTQIYNDGYRPILGTAKHPEALGISTRETFSEVWHIIGPMFDDVMKGKAVGFPDLMLPLNRNGYVEECYFDFAYSPIKLDSGEVGGVLVTVIETTNKKKAKDDLRDNKNELEFVIEAAELGTYDFNPLTNEFIANSRLKKWFGLPSQENIALTDAIDSIAENDRVRVSKAIAEVLEYSSGGIYDVEYTIVDAFTKKEIIVHAKGRAWFNEDQIAYRLTGTLEDVTSRVLARKKIEESERSLRLMILRAPVAIAIVRGDDYRVEIVNNLALNLWGRTQEQVLGLPLFETIPELLSQGVKEFADKVIETGDRFSTSEMPLKFLKNDVLETAYINFSLEALYDINGHINGLMAIGINVTPSVVARRKAEESEQSLRALVESAPFPIGVYTGESMRISLANQSILDAWGKGNDIEGKLFSDVVPELENIQVFKQAREVLRTGIPFHAKNQCADIINNGKLKRGYFNYSFTPIMDAEGNVHSVMNTAAEVTELNEAKLKVEESEKRFRDSVKQAPFGIAIFRGPDNVIEMTNSAYLELIDCSEAEFVGKPLFETLPEVKSAIAPIIADIYKTGKAFYGYEFPVELNRFGKVETGYYNFVYHPLMENEVISGIMVVATEVTANAKAKLLIEENEEKLNLIIDASELGIFDVDLKLGGIEASDQCFKILGFLPDANFNHSDLASTIHPDDLELRKAAFETAFATGTLRYQSRLLLNDNSVRWIDAKGKIFYDGEHTPERLLGTVRDITEEITFQQQLLEREEKFRLLADSMPQQIWTSDPEGKLNYFNQTVYDYSGFNLEQLNSNGWLEMVHPDDRKENIEQWTHSVKTGSDFLLEHRFRKFDGEYRWQLSRAIPQKDSQGNIKMWVGSSTDIQEQKMFTTELENKVKLRTNELTQKNIDLENMNKELQSFVYISSHDLQEPLRKIQTFSSRILETEHNRLSETAKRHFSRMQKSAERMQNLIQDLIAYSRTNIPETKFEIINLLEVIDDIKETLSEDLEQNDVDLRLCDICEVKIIPVQFKQVIHNLISNSIKFAKADHQLVIEINCDIVTAKTSEIAALAKYDSYAHIKFTDNGIGFESQYKEKIFEVFQRLHSKDDYTGTGIGLAIVKRIIDNHEGFILAKGNLNEGAVFDIYLPV